jgi:hypothetical protein
MPRACPSCGTSFPDYANVCHYDGVALLDPHRRIIWPRLNLNIVIGSLALAASLWAGTRLVDAYFGWNLYGSIESIELAGGETGTLRVDLKVENGTALPLESVRVSLETAISGRVRALETGLLTVLPGGSKSTMSVAVIDADLREAMLEMPPNGLLFDLKTEAEVCALGRCLPVRHSRKVLLKIVTRQV